MDADNVLRGDDQTVLPAAGWIGRRYSPQQIFVTDPKRPEPFRLRLARYSVLAQDISTWAAEAARGGRRLSILDIGCGWGPLLYRLEAEPNFAALRISGADLAVDGALYKRELYREFFTGDFAAGYPEIQSDRYDVVVCEQVLEHLEGLDTALATLVRVVRPGGVLVIGVPIFFPPLHLVRRYLVPPLRKFLGYGKTASHQQAFSLFSLLRLLRGYPCLRIVKTRGFRIISGGVLRPLENYRWWWQFNRRLGELLPALCVEAQVILEKSPVR